MGARIFISYRTADGADKATALARDLGRAFGDDAVFLDKDDLRGGSRWAGEIGHTLAGRPIVLLLVTPLLLGAADDQGRPRIAAVDDPVRREVEVAFAAGAHLIPLLCDGVDAPPPPASLPAPLDRLADLTWRRLRAYDWASDVRRLIADLRAMGVPTAAARTGRRPLLLGGGAAAALAAAGWAWMRPVDPIAGRWDATLWEGERTVVALARQADGVTLESEPIPIVERADWAETRRFWREQARAALDAVKYRGEGKVLAAPGQPVRLDIALTVHRVPEADEAVDRGHLYADLSPDGRRFDGRLWLNGAQAEQRVTLQRPP